MSQRFEMAAEETAVKTSGSENRVREGEDLGTHDDGGVGLAPG